MWSCEQNVDNALPDVKRFCDLLNRANDFFAPQSPLIVARAPGRLDVMGGIADYSGALVLEWPLAVATLVAVQQTSEPVVTIYSTMVEQEGGTARVTLPLAELLSWDYAEAHRQLTTHKELVWVAYVAGALLALHREQQYIPQGGLRIMVYCEIPVGKGVSSSAALEVATMQALCGLFALPMTGRELALLCQKVENVIVGAPSGVMDQMTVACGEQDSLLALLCQPAELQTPVALPPAITFWGIDSGITHAVSGSDYTGVRVGAFMGYRIIAELAGLPVMQDEVGHVKVMDSRWHGYLANIPPSVWESYYRDNVPVALRGDEFLARYGGTTDSVTHIRPEYTYAIRQPTAHPIYEHHRVRLFRSLLTMPSLGEEQLLLLGELMYQSHVSYSACGLGSAGTDRLVELVREAGPAKGLYGAKITGGGSGGTVAVLARRKAQAEIEHIVARYQQETGLTISLLGGSSPGAAAYGTLRFTYSA